MVKLKFIPPCPLIPFDLEPNPFDIIHSFDQVERRAELKTRYAEVRAWHSVKEQLMEQGYLVFESRGAPCIGKRSSWE